MKTTVIKSTTVYRRRLEDFTPAETTGDGSPGRRREIAAEQAMIAEIFGPSVTLTHDTLGRPALAYSTPASPDDLPLPNISIAHSATEIAIAVNDDCPIGIDIENWRNSLMKVASRFLTPAESELYNSSHMLLRAWTIKEAVYKAALTPGLALASIALPMGNLAYAHADGRKFAITMIDDSAATCLALAVPVDGDCPSVNKYWGTGS